MSSLKHRFPTVHNVIQLNGFPDGSYVRLGGWSLYKRTSGYAVSDGSSVVYINGIPEKYLTGLVYPNDVVHGLEIIAKVHKEEQDWGFGVYTDKTVLTYYEPEPVRCDCGAIHTSFPSQHSRWCSTQED